MIWRMKKEERRKKKEADSHKRREGGTLNLRPHTLPNVNPRSGFTLMEIVITMLIILILTLGVTLVIDPVEQVRRSRDTNRVADLDALRGAIDLALTESVFSGGADVDGASLNSCVGEDAQKVFVSVPSSEAPPVPSDLPAGWTYKQVVASALYNVDGTGWMPINLTLGGTVSSSISNLPIDPINTFASGQYYTYVCERSSRDFELTTRLNSKRFQTNGGQDAQSDDGGDDVFAYEVGPNLELDPKGPYGYWGMNEGSGTVIFDSSGNGNDATLSGTSWELTDCILGSCIRSIQPAALIQTISTVSIPQEYTVIEWIKADMATQSGDNIYGFGWDIAASSRHANGGVTPITGVLIRNIANDGYVGVSSSTDHMDNEWHMQAYTVDRGTLQVVVYLDGELEKSGVIASHYDDTISGLKTIVMAAHSVSYGEMDGLIDENVIYNRVLTAEEIAYQYETLKP